MKKILICVVGVIAVFILIVLDQFTKYLAVANLKDSAEYSLIDGVFSLRYLENHGAAFGILQGKQILFYIITIVIVVAVVYIYLRIPTEKRYLPLNIVLILIASGALGNFIDRFFKHYVVDFLYFKLINFPIFNVADVYVTGGAIALVVLLIFKYKDDDFKRIFGINKKKTFDYTHKGF